MNISETYGNMYWSPDKLLSRNKLFNFVVGNRGGGKSFGAKRMAIQRYLKKGEEFVYVRRYHNEFDNIKNFFADITMYYPDYSFEVVGGKFYCNDEVMGYYIDLSTSQKRKSSSFPKVSLIIFDEFIVDKGLISYIKGEVELFLDLYETIARMRENVVSLFISNAITTINPYFTYFNINLQPGAKFTVGEEWCIEYYKGVEFTEAKRQTRFGKFISGTRYGNYAIENEFYRDNKEFLKKMVGRCYCVVRIVYKGVDYTIWRNNDEGLMYFNTVKAPDYILTYCLSTSDHTPNYLLIRNIKTNSWFKELLYAYDMGLIRFDKLSSKEAFYEMMQIACG